MTARLPLLVITGPTATGKSAVAVEVALRVGGEVISADSMMVYRGMDIGTAKPTPAERKGVPHYLIDVVDPEEDFSVAAFQALAREHIQEINARGRLPILTGGTGLYIRAVVEGFRFAGGVNRELRRRLAEEARRFGPLYLHERLQAVDPEAAARIHPHNVKRVIRALEVFYQTGKPISAAATTAAPRYDALVFGLYLEREELYRRIEARVDAMLAAGLVDEVKRLLARGVPREATAMQALGYKEIAAYLKGEVTFEEAVRLLKRNTRRFAKRQFTWFKREEGIRWLDVAAYPGPAAIAEEIAAQVKEYFGR
ncbi:tRNA (adenosine(37)-N6)-dimethylallyltransferase MiaA [Thermodesulfitimonas autotrophica]|uniref:tRNA (adenosine(37)-N6)-dimethylallyltransferase MiaA n=1 Tax=Thermodesulfitimonas autotrophica TaxID=1894989 RepID=UPI000F4EAB72|nr:tRNA (adenosine(37)-N6)-dimethylallyltransferase MiaA [Thermodesulfitimonas autotrophica]